MQFDVSKAHSVSLGLKNFKISTGKFRSESVKKMRGREKLNAIAMQRKNARDITDGEHSN
jgi:hypothetical protein